MSDDAAKGSLPPPVPGSELGYWRPVGEPFGAPLGPPLEEPPYEPSSEPLEWPLGESPAPRGGDADDWWRTPLPAHHERRSGRRQLWFGIVAVVVVLALFVSALTALLVETTGTRQVSRASGPVLAEQSTTSDINVGVVDVDTQLGYQHAAAAGTGLVLTPNGEVVTNNHVIAGATAIKITIVTTGKSFDATVVGTDPTDDIAVLQAKDASALQIAVLGATAKLNIGDAVTAVGNARGLGGLPTVTHGQITGLDRTITASDETGRQAQELTGLIETSAPLQPGDSGGPLYNAQGQVIGINAAALARRRSSTLSDSYAIPIAKALSIVSQIENGDTSGNVHVGTSGFLGVRVGESGSGVVVTGVVSGTPAAKAGMHAGDAIDSIDGSKVDSASTLTTLLRNHHAGDRVVVSWTDGKGTSHQATITLIEGPAE